LELRLTFWDKTKERCNERISEICERFLGVCEEPKGVRDGEDGDTLLLQNRSWISSGLFSQNRIFYEFNTHFVRRLLLVSQKSESNGAREAALEALSYGIPKGTEKWREWVWKEGGARCVVERVRSKKERSVKLLLSVAYFLSQFLQLEIEKEKKREGHWMMEEYGGVLHLLPYAHHSSESVTYNVRDAVKSLGMCSWRIF
jgi:hypothetical protein